MREKISNVNTVADRIKKTRLELGLTQGQLADKVGVSQSTIGNIESGVRKRPRELLQIAKALGVWPEWLETGKGSKSGPPGERPPLKLVANSESISVRAAVELLAQIAAQQRPTLRKNLGNLLVDLIDHPDDTALIEQTITDIEKFFGT